MIVAGMAASCTGSAPARCAVTSPWETINVRPALSTRPVATNTSPRSRAMKLALYSTVITVVPAGTGVNAA